MNFNLNEVKIAVIGLGYVGLPLAIEFSKKYTVCGFDLNNERIKQLNNGIDCTNEIAKEQLLSSNQLTLTSTVEKLNDCNIYIITVPTPIDNNNAPD